MLSPSENCTDKEGFESQSPIHILQKQCMQHMLFRDCNESALTWATPFNTGQEGNVHGWVLGTGSLYPDGDCPYHQMYGLYP